MINLIMKSSDEDWKVPAGGLAHSSMPLSRYLEYTNDRLSLIYREVTPTVLENLKQIPCVLMTEFENEQLMDESSHLYSNIRVGMLESVAVKGKNLVYAVRISYVFEKANVDDYKVLGERFFFHLFETQRTHWAIKQVSLPEVMNVFKLTPPAPPQQAPALLQPQSPPNPGLLERPQSVTSVEAFLQKINEFQAQDGHEVFYRGHSYYGYKLEPSLFREDKAVPLYRYKERNMINEILTAHPAEFYQDHFMLDKLVRMQHYGLPTRLLDVTANPLVALYFCCADMLDKDEEEKVGDVKIFSVRTDDIKFYNSDTVSCIANLSLLNMDDQNKLIPETNVPLDERGEETPEMKKLLHFIRAEKPYFENGIRPGDLSRILFVRGRIANQRISSQSGAFLLFGHEAVLPDTGHSDDLRVDRIYVSNKKAILQELSRLNIKPSTIYPGIEETAREIARRTKGEEILNRVK